MGDFKNMLFLKRRRAPKPTFSAVLAPDEPFFAIGDVHGRLDLLERILQRMAARLTNAKQVFVGDYIDRGDHSIAVVRRLKGLQEAAPNQVICLKGNHEDMLLQFLESPASRGARWVHHGGLQTLAEMGIPSPGLSGSPASWEEVRDRLSEAIGPELLAWLQELPASWQSGNVAVVHAGASPFLPIRSQSPQALIWGDPDFVTVPRQDGIWVVHGHTIVPNPEVKQGRISIDTGAYATGRLTALLLVPGQTEAEFLQS